MDFLNDKIRPMYFRYLAAAFGSSFLSSIYFLVDVAMVGQYHGPDGAAALAVISPIWNVIYSLGLLMGIGGSVLFATLRGESSDNRKRSNEYFTAALIGVLGIAAVIWIGLILFDRQLLLLFGADEVLLPLARRYILPVKFAVPSFLLTQLVAAFLRNDGNPGLAARAVIFGGVFNIFGDYFFVFIMDMGIMGAGIATAMGSVMSLIIMLTHFFSKKNTLQLVRPTGFITKIKKITVTGFSTFFVDVAMGIVTVLFNRQLLEYLGTDALAIYGVIINVSTFVQCCAYSIGQAAQPIISRNYGAGQWSRIVEVLKCAVIAALAFGIFWMTAALAMPNLFIKLFMAPTESVLQVAPFYMRSYCVSYILMPANIFSTYYFQALLKPKTAFAVSVARGAVISGILIMVLPAFFGANAIWYAMPVTEILVAVVAALFIKKYTKDLNCLKQA